MVKMRVLLVMREKEKREEVGETQREDPLKCKRTGRETDSPTKCSWVAAHLFNLC